MDLPPPKSSSSPSPFGLVSVCGLVTELEDVGRVVALAGFGQEARRLPFLCRSLYLDEELLAATKDAVYGGLDRTRLMYAARVGAVRRVQVLLRPREVDVDAEDAQGCTALIHACAAGQTESVRLLLDGGADKDKEDSYMYFAPYTKFWGPLHYASATGHVGVVRLLLESGVQPDLRWDPYDPKAQPLHYACASGHVEIVHLLLEAGADEDTDDEDLHTPFIAAVEHGQESVVRFLLDRGQDVDGHHANGWVGDSSLYIAGDYDRLSMAELLLERGADVNLRGGSGFTPLHGAIGSVALTRLYLDRGADPEARDPDGQTPLQSAWNLLSSPTNFTQQRRQMYRDTIDVLEAFTASSAKSTRGRQPPPGE
jgi:ankyrin repeat protein